MPSASLRRVYRPIHYNTHPYSLITGEFDGLRKDPTCFCSFREIGRFTLRKSYSILTQGEPQRGIRVARDLEVHDF